LVVGLEDAAEPDLLAVELALEVGLALLEPVVEAEEPALVAAGAPEVGPPMGAVD